MDKTRIGHDVNGNAVVLGRPRARPHVVVFYFPKEAADG